MAQTLRRELRKKFAEVISRHILTDDAKEAERRERKLIAELVDIAIEVIRAERGSAIWV